MDDDRSPISPSAVGPALVQVKFPPSNDSRKEKDADIKDGLLNIRENMTLQAEYENGKRQMGAIALFV